jgi:hypothetical protein
VLPLSVHQRGIARVVICNLSKSCSYRAAIHVSFVWFAQLCIHVAGG